MKPHPLICNELQISAGTIWRAGFCNRLIIGTLPNTDTYTSSATYFRDLNTGAGLIVEVFMFIYLAWMS